MNLDPETLGFERVLSIGAHPDDGEFYAGATLARLAKVGAHVALLVLTDGQRGGREAGDLGAVRAAEQLEALGPLGARQHTNLGRPDGELVRDLGIIGEIVLAIRSFRPDLVLTHDPRTRFTIIEGITQMGHSDHRAGGEMAMDAVSPRSILPSFFPEQLERADVDLWYPRELWLFDTVEPNATVAVAPARDAKHAALRAHASQNERDSMVRWSIRHGDEKFVRLPLRRK